MEAFNFKFHGFLTIHLLSDGMKLIGFVNILIISLCLIDLRSAAFGSIINHVFSCDCFIAENAPYDDLLRSNKVRNSKKNAIIQRNPKLVVIHPAKKTDANNLVEDSAPQKLATWDPITSFDNLLNILQKSKEKLSAWMNLDDDPTRFAHKDAPEDSQLFSLEKGFVTRNIFRLGRFLQLFDKFDCRCAGNISSILNAERFVRFTVAHF